MEKGEEKSSPCNNSEDTSHLSRNRSFKSKQLVRSQAIRESTSPPRTSSPYSDSEQSYNTAKNTAHDSAVYVNTAYSSGVNVNDAHSAGVHVNIANSGVQSNTHHSGVHSNTAYSSGVHSNTAYSSGVHSNTAQDSAVNVNDSSHNSDVCSAVNSCIDKNSDDGDEIKKQHVEIQITSGSWDAESQTEQRQRTKRWLGYKHHSDSSRDLLSNHPRVMCVCGACAACPHCRGRRRRHPCPTKQDSGIVCSDECPDCNDSDTGGPIGDGSRKSGSLDVNDQSSYCRCPERKEKPKSASFCKSESEDKMDPTGAELVNFIKETLNKNPRDRMTLLKIERELHALVNDTGRCIVRFPVMTSYGRMLVHRCASLYQLQHHLDQHTKTAVLVSKTGTSGGRIPCTSFQDWCTVPFPPSPQRIPDNTHAKCILKRSTASLEEGCGSRAASRSKSLEQREKEYERVRRRIFSSDGCTDESQCPWLNSGNVKLLTPDTGRNKLQKVQSLESGSGSGCGSGSWRSRGAVSKSHSFGGYGGDSQQTQPRLLSRQGDLASSSWRVSPSSSGYKTLSLRSTDSVTPSPTGDNASCTGSPEPTTSGAVVWAVTDLSAVPPGALVIHPQTGRPLTNPDGSVYHFDPSNPPVLPDLGNTYIQDEIKIEETNEKKRGRLEKQQSFIDNDNECRQSEGCHRKCCCECRGHDADPPRHNGDKTPIQQEQNQEPPSQEKNSYDQPETSHNKEKYTNRLEKEPDTDLKPNYETQKSHEHRNNENQKSFDETNQRSDVPPPSQSAVIPPNHRAEVPKEKVLANQNTGNSTNQRVVKSNDSHEMQYTQNCTYRNEEITSPQSLPPPQYVHQDFNMMLQAKVAPMIHEHSIRPLSVPNVMYPNQMPPNYAYINQCRIDQPLQPMYQPILQPEEHKVAPMPHQDNTFRIDPSYPFPTDMQSACGPCCPEQMRRGYNLPYDIQAPPPALPQYPVHNLVIPPPHVQQYPVGQYQEPVQWGPLQPPKLFVHELYPVPQYQPGVYPPQYNVLYPQMLPQPYPVCQPMYSVPEKYPERQNSLVNKQRRSVSNASTARNTPMDDKSVPYTDSNKDQNGSNEIAVKIQQIKDQMAQLSTRDRDKDRDKTRARGTEEWRRRNSGNGILGSYPNNNGRVGAVNDESQLSNAARAIVNSIRSMNHKNNSYQDNRRPDNYHRDRTDRRPDRPAPDHQDAPPARPDRNVNVPVYHRPPYLFRQMNPGTWCRRSPAPVHPDPSYPFPTDMQSACGPCCPEQMRRGYNLPYDIQAPPPALPQYPVHNLVIPPPHVQQYPVGQYQEPVQWGPLQPPKLFVHELYPVPQYQPGVYPPQYNVLYPQMLPQTYPVCQPMYPVPEKYPERQNSLVNKQRRSVSNASTARNTPMDDKSVPYTDSNKDQNGSNEIAVKIQQIKDQMAQLSTRDRDKDRDKARARGTEEWRRRNSGNGILGSYPNNNGRVGAVNDESQLSNAARAIVNSIRSMNHKNNSYQDNRRPDNYHRDRTDRRPDRPAPDHQEAPPGRPDRNVNVPVYHRPPYLFRQMNPGTWCRRSPAPVHPDPSYPFPTDMQSACGPCCPEQMRRGYNLPYDIQAPPPALPQYPVHNLVIPPPHVQQYPVGQYQEPVQWGPLQPPKLFVHELYPVPQYQPGVYPPQYNVLYPQMLPQTYPVCQPMYPVPEKYPERQNSLVNKQRRSVSNASTARNTPMDDKSVPYTDSNKDQNGSNEIAVKIQQIKDQMAQLSTRDRDKDRDKARARGTEEWRRRNSGNGILGSYPNNNGRVGAVNDESQLSNAARAIVNSIRSMNHKNNSYQDNRRPDNYHRDRTDRRPDRPAPDHQEAPPGRPDRNVNVPVYHRPPYLFRQMNPGTWCRRSPAPVHPALNNPRRQHPDSRNFRR